MNRLSRFLSYYSHAINRCLKLYLYRRSIPSKVIQLREKEKIKVLFVLSDVSLWKTEGLYRAMLEHPRFDPILGTCLLNADVPSESIRKYKSLIDYITKKGYTYEEIFDLTIHKVNADIVFYQQPYEGFISPRVSYQALLDSNSLVCDVHYSMRTLAINRKNKWVIDVDLYRHCWQMYVENDLTAAFGKVSILKGSNIVVTGMPIQDELLKDKTQFSNPWKEQTKAKKRIVYAPHHTIPTASNMIHLSCFLDVCDFMLEMADKYADKIQIAFKPHPFLRNKLVEHWGQEKTDSYYQRWATMDNTQLSEGEYISLFSYSDAMIHDSDSFTLEYTFMKKPVIFLVNPDFNEVRKNDLNTFGQMAYDLHDKGFSKQEIEQFIVNVIAGVDSRKEERENFCQSYLFPPYGKTASQNIINSILGIEEYTKK